jgi:LysR family transcriptional regulator, hydrogen peroxide-inducible genes activator
MITLIQLEYIVAVDTYRHFAQAAEHCFVTQPTLSMQIKKLEDDLGVKIFDRSKQPVIPTDIGQEILSQAREVLASAGRIGDLVKHHIKDFSGELKIGIIPTLAPYLLPLFAGSLKKDYPGVILHFEELITETIAEKLLSGRLDAGIFVTPYNNPGIVEQVVFYEEMLVYAHPEHRLALQEKVSVADAARPDIWLLSDGHCFRSQVVNLCSFRSEEHNNLPFHLEGGSIETLIRVIDREGGFTLIPELAYESLSPGQKNNVRHFSDATPVREVSVCYSRHYIKRRLIQLLIDEIKKAIPGQMQDPGHGNLVKWKK